MNLSRVRLSQTFGIIFDFCGIPAALPLSASAVAVRYPWRRRTRYGSGRGCFSRPLQESPRLMLETSLQPQVWTVSTFTLLPLQQPAGVIVGHRFGRSCRQRHTHEHTDRLIRHRSRCGPHLVPRAALPVGYFSRVHAVKRENVTRHPAAAIYARLRKTPRKQAFDDISHDFGHSIFRLARPAVLISRQQLTELIQIPALTIDRWRAQS